VRYEDLVQEVVEETTRRAEEVVGLGVPRGGVLIDPTHDFGKNTWHSLALLRHADVLVATGWPVLMALSNKDFIGETLGVDLQERLDGTLAATALAAHDGAQVFRVHEVRQTRRVLEMVAAIEGHRPPARALRGLA
jgi:dihydropteroate synthase